MGNPFSGDFYGILFYEMFAFTIEYVILMRR